MVGIPIPAPKRTQIVLDSRLDMDLAADKRKFERVIEFILIHVGRIAGLLIRPETKTPQGAFRT